MATLPSIPKLPSTIQLPGSVIDAATKAANAAKAAAEAAVPSFGSLMDAAKASVSTTAASIGGGGLFKDASAAVASVAASFGIGGDNPNTEAFEAYKKQVADVQKNAMIDMAIAKAALSQKVKEATAAGQTIGAGAISGALDATKSLQNFQANLTNPAALAADAVATAAAKAEAITALKANTMLAMLSKPLPTTLAGAVGSNMNPALVNNLTKFNIIKAQETSATQPVAGQRTPSSSTRPNVGSISASLDSPTAPPITQPPVDRRVYTAQVAAYETKKDNSKVAYLAHLGLTWSKGQPDFTKAERDAALLVELDKVYDAQVGRTGANDDRKSASAIKKAKPPADRTPEETALIDKVETEKKIFYTKAWWTKKGELYDTYDKYYENYKIVYDCWINNGDRFSLPAAVEKELAAS
jgi:hypothetical protein